MTTENVSIYKLSIGARILYVFLILLCGSVAYSILFGGAQLNFFILELLGISSPILSLCLNIFVLIICLAVMAGGIIMFTNRTALTISEGGFRYVSGKIDRELKWDELERVNLIAKDTGAAKSRALEFYEKSDPAKISLSFDISYLEKRDEIISRIRYIVSAKKITYKF